jgi:hypothetical protein
MRSFGALLVLAQGAPELMFSGKAKKLLRGTQTVLEVGTEGRR